jgi:hypothetical protein
MVKSNGFSAGATGWTRSSKMRNFSVNSLASRSLARLLSLALVAATIFAFSLAALAVDPPTPPPAHTLHHKAHKKAPPPLVLPPLPAGPLAQLPMDQLPAAAPKIKYENGLLTIGAQNATLADILHEVHDRTGATIDIPPSGAGERVVVQLGPGAPRDVLAALLNGTSFNYVMLGTASNPTSVASVTLMAKASAGGEVQTAVFTPSPVDAPTPFQTMQPPMPGRPPLPNFRNGPTMVQPASAQPAAADDDADDDSADDKDDDSDQAQPAQGQPGAQPPGAVTPDSSSQDQNNQPNAGPKTPEQILQMIRDGQRPGPAGSQPPQPPQE